MKIRCVVIDDEPIALEKLRNYVSRIPYLELVAACDSPVEAMKVLAQENVDAIFTDISMPGINGMDFVSSLSKVPFVVFITSYSEYAVESYKVGAVDYILKPYGMKEFQRAAERVRAQYETKVNSVGGTNAGDSNSSIFIRTDYKWVRVNISDIMHIQGMGDYLRVSLESSNAPLITLSTFANIKSCLPADFIQVHRSWIVNLIHIKVIERNIIITDDNTHIPVGDTYKDALNEWLEERSIGKTGGCSQSL